ncbi:hypothetical protein KIN20_015637 [Parelaphostrongylus tenuis]|uniref:Uncharacterized protein n=1 Tax=Parelaphostrongylus tenuis TaxID=148309 RepID=A0AAD5QP65_PARTN|nr:hypothetical protein KIN20_015637 [Parelaphostrongylus tenuis]
MPQGQATTRNFTVSGFTLPVAMVFTGAPSAPTQFPGISSTSSAAKSFVSRLVMQTIEYDPFECKTVSVPDPSNEGSVFDFQHQLAGLHSAPELTI